MPSTTTPDDTRTAHRGNWAAVASVAFGAFVMVTIEVLPIGLLSRIAADLDVTEGRAGWMVTLPGLAAAVAAPVAAYVLRGVDRRRVLVALTALVLGASLIGAVASDLMVMLVGRALLGAAVGGFWAFAAAVGRRLVADRDGATATAIVLAGISVGTVLGLPIGTLIGDWLGWRAAFEVGAVLSAVAMAAQWLSLPDLPPVGAVATGGLRALAGNASLRAGFAFAVPIVVGHFAAYTYLEPILARWVGLAAPGVGLALTVYGVANLVGNFVGAAAAERGVLRAFRVVAALLCLSVLGLSAAGRSPGLAMVSAVGWGAAFGAVPACIQAWLYRASPAAFEVSSAVMVSVFQAALAIGAWLGGGLVDTFGLALPLLVGAGCAGGVAIALMSYRSPALAQALSTITEALP